MSWTLRAVLGALGVGLIAGAYGVQQYVLAAAENRETVDQSAQLLATIPLCFGPWRANPGEERNTLDGCYGRFITEYINVTTGERIEFELLFGPATQLLQLPRPQRQSPDPRGVKCGNGALPRQRVVIDADNQFWSTSCPSDGDSGQTFRTCYGWTRGDKWKAPSQPNWEFANVRLLYRLRVSSESTRHPWLGDDPCTEFLTQSLPAIAPHLGSAGPAADLLVTKDE
jgi:hypothetical protein